MVDSNLLKDQKIQKIVASLTEEGAVHIGIFGSYARGTSKEDSDIDILVRFKEGIKKSLLDMVRIENSLSDAIHHKVDLLTEKAISPYLIDRIKNEERVVYE